MVAVAQPNVGSVPRLTARPVIELILILLGFVVMAVSFSIVGIVLGFVIVLVGVALFGTRSSSARRERRRLQHQHQVGAYPQGQGQPYPPAVPGQIPAGALGGAPLPPPPQYPSSPQNLPPPRSAPPAARFCTACGTGSAGPGSFCSSCGKPLPAPA